MQKILQNDYLGALAERLFRIKVLHKRIAQEFGIHEAKDSASLSVSPNHDESESLKTPLPMTPEFVHNYAVQNLILTEVDIKDIANKVIASVDEI